LLLKDDVGKSKPSTHELPSQGFTYGRSAGHDAEGAGAVISSWKVHRPSTRGAVPRDFRRLNAKSVSQGCFTAKHVKAFRGSNDDLQAKPPTAGKTSKASVKAEDDLFGVPCRPRTPIDAVISNLYRRVAAKIKTEEYSQPVIERKIGRLRLP
jgi:hypothetical protein